MKGGSEQLVGCHRMSGSEIGGASRLRIVTPPQQANRQEHLKEKKD